MYDAIGVAFDRLCMWVGRVVWVFWLEWGWCQVNWGWNDFLWVFSIRSSAGKSDAFVQESVFKIDWAAKNVQQTPSQAQIRGLERRMPRGGCVENLITGCYFPESVWDFEKDIQPKITTKPRKTGPDWVWREEKWLNGVSSAVNWDFFIGIWRKRT